MTTPRTEKGNAPGGRSPEASSEANPFGKESNMVESKAVQVSSQPVFNFGEHSVRVVVRDGEPWFVATDVAVALGYRDAANAGRILADHQKGTQIVSTPSGEQRVTIINESGLYRLVLRSRKPEAEKFSDWVTGEVLPAIRKTGVYVGKPFTVNPGDVLTAEEQNTLRLMLKSAVEKLPKAKQAGAMVQGWSKLKAHFGVPYREIPRLEFSEAVSIIARHTTEWELEDDEPKPAPAPAIPSGKMFVDRQKLVDMYQDLGKLRARIDGLGIHESDLPPSWWVQHRISAG